MRRSVVLYGASDESLGLLPVLEESPDVEIVAIFDPDLAATRERLTKLHPSVAERMASRLVDRTDLLSGPVGAVVDAGTLEPFAQAFPEASGRGIQIVSPLTARLLFGYGGADPAHKAELLQALREIVESVNLTVDTDELFARMLEIAMAVTGADGGSLMLLDPGGKELRIRVARGVEPELWPKIRVPVGSGVAGRVAALGRPLKIRGRAEREDFRLLRERIDVESALCVPLIHAGRTLGVLNLHHSNRSDAFDDDDLAFAEELGHLDAQIIHRAQEHEQLRRDASRYSAVREVRAALAGTAPLLDRLAALCRNLAERMGDGVATVQLHDPDEHELRLGATSLAGAGLGAELRTHLGEGLEGRAAESRSPLFLRQDGGRLGFAALPLLSGSHLVGVLSVQTGGREPSLGRGRALEETLLEVAAAVADEVAQSERETRIQSRANKVSAINEAGIRLVSTRDLAEVARLATSSGALILDADHAVLRLQDPETRRYVIRSYYGSADGRTQERLFRLDKQVAVDSLKLRAPRLVRHVDEVPAYVERDGGASSVMSAPLARQGAMVGTLSLYDKIRPDAFHAGPFRDDDFQIFNRWVSYVERALDGALSWSRSQQHKSFDEETGLPNADYLARRVEQEVARAATRPGSLCVATCRIENFASIRQRGDAGHVERLLQKLASSLREQLRDFDVLARSADDEFAMLLPEPGNSEARVTELARSVADQFAKEERWSRPERPALAFGHAVHPADGESGPALMERARQARIRLI
ncbi:MAG: GAF domain-containing protein [Myxococcota bacterium]|nr:GAF domain-containing protein [Myxococcota bacterium]